MAAVFTDTNVSVRKNGDTGRMLKRIQDGDMSLAELSSEQLNDQEVIFFLARELHFLGRIATIARIPYLHDLLEELHFALLQKVNR